MANTPMPFFTVPATATPPATSVSPQTPAPPLPLPKPIPLGFSDMPLTPNEEKDVPLTPIPEEDEPFTPIPAAADPFIAKLPSPKFESVLLALIALVWKPDSPG